MRSQVLTEGTEGSVFLWGRHSYGLREDKEAESLTAEAAKRMGGLPYTLIAYEVQSWNGAFSPWPCRALDESFFGGGERTLCWLLEELVPEVRSRFGRDRKVYLLGYSLAGLFSLWAMGQTEVFGGAGCCSGSLWYPGFLEWLKAAPRVRDRNIYISLGGKEAATGNRLMAGVAECTRETVELLRQENAVKYELNPGGHFADSGKRLSKAIWHLTQMERYSKTMPEKMGERGAEDE